MIGLRQELIGQRIKATRASRDGGTYVMTDKRDKVVTVTDVRMLVTATAPSRAVTGTRLVRDFFILLD